MVGFEPTPAGIRTTILHYPKTRHAPSLGITLHLDMVGVAGFEPATYRSQSGRSKQAELYSDMARDE